MQVVNTVRKDMGRREDFLRKQYKIKSSAVLKFKKSIESSRAANCREDHNRHHHYETTDRLGGQSVPDDFTKPMLRFRRFVRKQDYIETAIGQSLDFVGQERL